MNSSETYRKEIKKLAGESKYISDKKREAIKKAKRDLILLLTIFSIITAGAVIFLIQANAFAHSTVIEIITGIILIGIASYLITDMIMAIYLNIVNRYSYQKNTKNNEDKNQEIYSNNISENESLIAEPYASIYGFKDYELRDD